jgi:hypothetical protein
VVDEIECCSIATDKTGKKTLASFRIIPFSNDSSGGDGILDFSLRMWQLTLKKKKKK